MDNNYRIKCKTITLTPVWIMLSASIFYWSSLAFSWWKIKFLMCVDRSHSTAMYRMRVSSYSCRQNHADRYADTRLWCYITYHDDVIKWKHFPRYWPFVRGIHWSPVNSPHKGQWRGALMFSLICVWINACVNNREAGDLRRYPAHYDVTIMFHEVSTRFCCALFCCGYMNNLHWTPVLLLLLLLLFSAGLHQYWADPVTPVPTKQPLNRGKWATGILYELITPLATKQI